MPRFIENIKTLAQLRARGSSKGDAAIRVGDLGAIFLWSTDSTAADDGVDVIRPSSIAAGSPGRWVNDSKAPRFYNKSVKFTLPTKELIDTYVPTTNPFVINISHMGLTEKPKWINIVGMEVRRASVDYVIVNVVDDQTTKDQVTVELTRPIVGLSLNGNAAVRIGNSSSSLSMITLPVRLIGV